MWALCTRRLGAGNEIEPSLSSVCFKAIFIILPLLFVSFRWCECDCSWGWLQWFRELWSNSKTPFHFMMQIPRFLNKSLVLNWYYVNGEWRQRWSLTRKMDPVCPYELSLRGSSPQSQMYIFFLIINHLDCFGLSGDTCCRDVRLLLDMMEPDDTRLEYKRNIKKKTGISLTRNHHPVNQDNLQNSVWVVTLYFYSWTSGWSQNVTIMTGQTKQ